MCRKLGDQHLCEYTSDLFSASRLACREREGTMCSYRRRFFVSKDKCRPYALERPLRASLLRGAGSVGIMDGKRNRVSLLW